MTETRKVLMDELTWPEYQRLVQGGAVIFLPVASTEQHGHHLPLGVDRMQAMAVSIAVATRVGGIVAPPIAYGMRSNARSGGGEIFPGTTSLSGTTLTAVVRDVLKAFIRHGAKKIVVMDAHYENSMFIYEGITAALEETGAKDVKIVKNLFLELLDHDTIAEAYAPQPFPGWDLEHAAHVETSLMLAIRPDLVRLDRIQPDWNMPIPRYDVYPQPGGMVPPSGALSNPATARREVGQLLIDRCVELLVAMVEREFPRA